MKLDPEERVMKTPLYTWEKALRADWPDMKPYNAKQVELWRELLPKLVKFYEANRNGDPFIEAKLKLYYEL